MNEVAGGARKVKMASVRVKVRACLDFYSYFFGKQKAKDAFFSITSRKSIRFWVHEWLEFEDLNEHQLFNCKNN
jgi:hypothetical protein